MTQEDKQLLLADLCARLPYQVKVSVNGGKEPWTLKGMFDGEYTDVMLILEPSFPSKDVSPQTSNWQLLRCKPYLRPMSSMTEEEREELLNHVLGGEGVEYFHIAHDGSIDGNQEAEQDLYNLNLHWLNFGPLTTSSYIDWLNKKMFDFRGLISKGRAIAVTEENNPYKD